MPARRRFGRLAVQPADDRRSRPLHAARSSAAIRTTTRRSSATRSTSRSKAGANRTSGLTVQGVGAANREQIEKAFFRALTALMPSSSTFALTRVATIQAARDLYGAGSSAERAITQAWDAVGVQERTAAHGRTAPEPRDPIDAPFAPACPTRTGCSASPLQPDRAPCASRNGCSISSTTPARCSRSRGVPGDVVRVSPSTPCGPGSTTILAQTDACTAFCVSLQRRHQWRCADHLQRGRRRRAAGASSARLVRRCSPARRSRRCRIRSTSALLSLVMIFFCCASARGQSAQWTDRGYVNVSGWFQPSSSFSNTDAAARFC